MLAGIGLAALTMVSASAALTNGLTHHWNFDEGPDWHDSPFESVCTNTVALDCVNGANATLQNMGGSNWVSGRQFTALQFDGVNEYLAVATNLANTLGGTASLSFWLRTTQTGAVSAATAPGIAGVAGSGGVQWGWLDDAGRIGLAVDNTLVVRSTNAVNDGQWHHVVLTRDSATGAGQVYLDGVLSATATGRDRRARPLPSPAWRGSRTAAARATSAAAWIKSTFSTASISGGEVAMLADKPRAEDLGHLDRGRQQPPVHHREHLRQGLRRGTRPAVGAQLDPARARLGDAQRRRFVHLYGRRRLCRQRQLSR